MKNKLCNIVLTGFRATGKTTVGRSIARRLGYGFIDTDTEICRQLGASVAEIVAQYGWPHFRKAEAKLLESLCAASNMIIATGGGAIEHQAQWQDLRRRSFVVWLDADVATIKKRISSDPVSVHQRPDLSPDNASVEDETAQILQRRNPLYSAGSDLRLDTGSNTPEELAASLQETIILLMKMDS
ncbi:MAG: shikimate kinase [Desulfobulbus sp.]|nr:shikimate kinase [Desulfobulbus sp.]